MTCSKLALILPEKAGRMLAASAGVAAAHVWAPEKRRLHQVIDRVYYVKNRRCDYDINVLIKRLFIHFSLNVYELLRFPELNAGELEKKVVFHNQEVLDAALAEKRGVILALPHIGNWEILGAAIAHRGYALNSFYMAQKEDQIGSLLDFFRSFSGIRLHDRDRGGIKALRALRDGEILGMITDQDGANIGVYLDFLGHFVSMPAGPANWSLKTGARLVPLYSLRRGMSATFDAWFLPPLPEEHADTHQQKVIDRTLKLCQWMEELILNHPDQYLWIYDRFKPRHEAWLTAGKQKCGQMLHGVPWYG